MNNSSVHTLRMPGKQFQKLSLIFLLLFVVSLCVMNIPMTDDSFPEPVVLIARIVTLFSITAAIVCMVIFLFYRTKEKVYLDEKGIQLPQYPFIPWQSLQWYKINLIPNQGISGMVLKADHCKAMIQAEDDESLHHLTEELKEKIQLYNPSAKDFRELKTSKVKAVIFSILTTAVFLGIYLLLDPGRMGLIIWIPLLLISIGAIWMEHVKLFKQSS